MVEKDLLALLRAYIAELEDTLFLLNAGIEPTTLETYEVLRAQMRMVRVTYKKLVKARIKRESEIYGN